MVMVLSVFYSCRINAILKFYQQMSLIVQFHDPESVNKEIMAIVEPLQRV